MTNKAIGPSFAEEIKAAGLMGLPFSWGEDGAITFGESMTSGQIAAVNAVYDSHNPANPSITREIQDLENSITPRMLQEAAIGSTATGLGTGGTMTAAQFIAAVRSQIATLRSEL